MIGILIIIIHQHISFLKYIAIQIWIGKVLFLAWIWTHYLRGTSLTRNQLERIWTQRVLSKIQFGLIRINTKLSKTDCSNKKCFSKSAKWQTTSVWMAIFSTFRALIHSNFTFLHTCSMVSSFEGFFVQGQQVVCGSS